MKSILPLMSAVSLLAFAGPSAASIQSSAEDRQYAPSQMTVTAWDSDSTQVSEVVVVASRIGLPMWTVRRGDEGVLIIVGNIREVPPGFQWRKEALEDAVRRSDRVLYPQEGRASMLDVMRVLWRSRTIVYLPNQGTIDQVIPAEDYRRLEALMAGESDDDWRRRRPLISGMILSQKRTGDDDADDPNLERVVARAARRAKVKAQHIGVVRGSELVDSLITSSPESQLPCLRVSMAAAEYGPNAVADRAEAWRKRDVLGVMANPFDAVTDECWPWGDPRVRGRMRTEWVNAISRAVSEQGVTLAIAPIRTLGEEGGVLDMLEAQGFEIDGPAWRAGDQQD